MGDNFVFSAQKDLFSGNSEFLFLFKHKLPKKKDICKKLIIFGQREKTGSLF